MLGKGKAKEMSTSKKVIYMENIGSASHRQLASHLVLGTRKSWHRVEVVFLYNKMQGVLPLCAAVRVPSSLYDTCWQKHNSNFQSKSQRLLMSTPVDFKVLSAVRWIEEPDGTRLSAKLGVKHWALDAVVRAKPPYQKAREMSSGEVRDTLNTSYAWSTNSLAEGEHFCYAAVDCGSLLMEKEFKNDVDSVIQRACQSGVQRFILKGSSLMKAVRAKHLASMYPGLMRFSVGYHPNLEFAWREDKMVELREMAADPACVAVGECGLDFSEENHNVENQIHIFRQQLQLACELRKPVLVYERAAKDKLLEILSLYRDMLPSIAVRSHKPAADFMDKVTKLGCYFVLTGALGSDFCPPICSEWSKVKWQLEYVLVASNAPSDAPTFFMLTEYERALKKVSYRDYLPSAIEWVTNHCHVKRNEPCCIPGVIEFFAAAVQLPAKDVANICLENSKRFFQETAKVPADDVRKGSTEASADDVSKGSTEKTTASWKREQTLFWLPLAVLIVVIYISTLCVCDIFCWVL